MKLANLLPAAQWNLSTPIAARNLLRLFAITLVAGFYIGAYGYMRMTLNQLLVELDGFKVRRRGLMVLCCLLCCCCASPCAAAVTRVGTHLLS